VGGGFCDDPVTTTSRVFLVRHAKAGNREAWSGPDEIRPLSSKGRAQAEALVAAFACVDVGRILTSSYVRCRQTVQPLALARALSLELAPELREGARTDETIALLVRVASSASAVLCSHGDVIPAAISWLAAHGMEIDGEPGWKKGSIWALDREEGGFTRARYLGVPGGA
jgi:phosphohistidine phosphatase SixA